ncbi:hypothetical protein ACQ9BO_20380 [Flavobacterium sp. P21]
MNAFEATEQNGKTSDLYAKLEGLVNSQNQSNDTNSTLIPATYLRVTVSV